MKNAIFFALILAAAGIRAQTDSTVWRYAELTITLGGFDSKTKAVVDFGETVSGWIRPADMIEGPDGKPIRFRSPIDALNYMSVRGWELVQAYRTTEASGLSKVEFAHFILRRRELYRAP